MTNGEKIQTILDIDKDCINVHGENGKMTFTVTQDFWNSECKESRWVPVTERLPENGKEVLTCNDGGFIEIQSLEDSCNDGYWENQKGDWTDFDEVIAWMPLPKEYEEGQE